VQRFGETRRPERLYEVVNDAELDGGADDVGFRVSRNDDDLDRVARAAQLTQKGDSVPTRESEIEEDEFRPERGLKVARFRSRACKTHNGEARLAGNMAAMDAGDRSVVLDHENTPFIHARLMILAGLLRYSLPPAPPETIPERSKWSA
jgi:hypothetical protein